MGRIHRWCKDDSLLLLILITLLFLLLFLSFDLCGFPRQGCRAFHLNVAIRRWKNRGNAVDDIYDTEISTQAVDVVDTLGSEVELHEAPNQE